MQNHAAGVTDVGCEGKNTRGSNAPMSKKITVQPEKELICDDAIPNCFLSGFHASIIHH